MESARTKEQERRQHAERSLDGVLLERKDLQEENHRVQVEHGLLLRDRDRLEEQNLHLQQELASWQFLAQERLDKMDKLRADLQKQQAAIEHRIHSAAVSNGVTWQYETDGQWNAMPSDANEELVQAYLAYLRENSTSTRHRTIISAGVGAGWISMT